MPYVVSAASVPRRSASLRTADTTSTRPSTRQTTTDSMKSPKVAAAACGLADYVRSGAFVRAKRLLPPSGRAAAQPPVRTRFFPVRLAA